MTLSSSKILISTIKQISALNSSWKIWSDVKKYIFTFSLDILQSISIFLTPISDDKPQLILMRIDFSAFFFTCRSEILIFQSVLPNNIYIFLFARLDLYLFFAISKFPFYILSSSLNSEVIVMISQTFITWPDFL